jgi:hypothetical protein
LNCMCFLASSGRVVIPRRAKGHCLEAIFDFLEQLVHGCGRHLLSHRTRG